MDKTGLKIAEKSLTIFLALVVLGSSAYFAFKYFRGPLQVPLSQFDPNQSCPGPKYSFVMGDQYMRGIVEQGEALTVTMNYYSCNPPQLDDIVLLRFSNTADPVVRIVKALPGDEFELMFSKEKQQWFAEVNKKPVRQFDGQVHYFGDQQKPLLSQYEKLLKGKLSGDLVMLFCSQPPCLLDSTQFGLVALKDIMGKIEKGRHGPMVEFIKDLVPKSRGPASREPASENPASGEPVGATRDDQQ